MNYEGGIYPEVQSLWPLVRIRMRRQASDLAWDFEHVARVWNNARRIARHASAEEGWEVNGPVLEAATLLHAIGRGAERRDEHPAEASARIAEDTLRAEGLAALVWPVCEAILTFDSSFGREPPTPEACILADANGLDNLGAIGVTRALLQAANRATPALYDRLDPRAQARALDEGAYVLDVFPKRLLTLQDTMKTRFARSEAERQTRVVRAFYDAVLRDAGVDD